MKRHLLLSLMTAAALLGGSVASADATPKKYVAFGDSYASGDGLSPYRDTDCKRSYRNYPSKVAASLQITDANWVDFTCAGARSDLTRGPNTTWGGLQDQVFTWAVNQSVLDANTTKLVTITIGGNDYWRSVQPEAGTGTPYQALDLCGQANWPCENDTSFLTASEVNKQAFTNKVYASVQKIHALAPNAKILIVGYPGIVPRPAPAAGQVTCNGGGFFGWSYGPNAELVYLHGILSALKTAEDLSTDQMEQTLEAANGQPATVNFVDTYTPSDLHDMCRVNAADRWVDRPDSATPRHPTENGMTAFASRVVTSYNTLN